MSFPFITHGPKFSLDSLIIGKTACFSFFFSFIFISWRVYALDR